MALTHLNLMADLPVGIQILNSAQECIENSDVIVLMHLDDNYSKLFLDNIVLIDPWTQVQTRHS